MNVCLIISAAVLVMNLIAFAAFGIDKRKARLDKWRIPESTLLLLAFLFGSLGALLGMRAFRHKTRHWKFRILVPLFLVLQVALTAAFVATPSDSCLAATETQKKAAGRKFQPPRQLSLSVMITCPRRTEASDRVSGARSGTRGRYSVIHSPLRHNLLPSETWRNC